MLDRAPTRPLPHPGLFSPGGVGSDLIWVSVSFVGAHLLRFGGLPPGPTTMQMLYLLPFVIVLKIGCFQLFGLYQGLWQHAGTPDAIRLLRAVSVASGALFVGGLLLSGPRPAPIALLLLDGLLTITTTAGHRFARRARRQIQARSADETKHVLIYGADEYGILLLRYLRNTAASSYSVAGFLDPDHNGLRLQGVPVVEAPQATEAEGLIVPIPPGTAAQRDPRSIFAEYAPDDYVCFRFELGLSPSADRAPEPSDAALPSPAAQRPSPP
jgi:UDP-GlcNAc:undecaprenyl-phosphate GlcNAc-1-phosphate transferase